MSDPPLLDVLKSEEFEVRVGHFLPIAAMRKRLESLPEVHQAIGDLGRGAISEPAIRQFVSTLMTEFRPGQRFSYDLTLAVLAVVLERRPTEFADEFITDLATRRLTEMPLSIRMARACSKHRAK